MAVSVSVSFHSAVGGLQCVIVTFPGNAHLITLRIVTLTSCPNSVLVANTYCKRTSKNYYSFIHLYSFYHYFMT